MIVTFFVKQGVVEIVTGTEYAESEPLATYGFKDWWGKVKEAAKKFGEDTKAIVMKQIEAMKPQIIEQLKKMQTVVIDGVKKVVIQIVNDAVQIIIGGEVVESSKIE